MAVRKRLKAQRDLVEHFVYLAEIGAPFPLPHPKLAGMRKWRFYLLGLRAALRIRGRIGNPPQVGNLPHIRQYVCGFTSWSYRVDGIVHRYCASAYVAETLCIASQNHYKIGPSMHSCSGFPQTFPHIRGKDRRATVFDLCYLV
jgi:hypothetical protein